MEQNFLPPQAPHPLRHLVGLFVVVVVLSGFGFYRTGAKVLGAEINLADGILPFSLPQNSAGGDVTVEPPVPEPPKLPQLHGTLPTGETFTAKSVLVKDVETGTNLYSKSEYESRSLASITKLMSGLVLLERPLDFASSTVVSSDDVIDTHMYAGDTYTLQELWDTAFIGSSNKAILTLVDASGWDRNAFVERMNEKARELGMGNTQFVEPTGLDEKNVSTASDVALLLQEALKQPKIAESLLTPEYDLYAKERKSKHHLWNTDWLLLGWIENPFAEFKGGKTGYITASGYNFTMQVANENGHFLDVVVLGADTHEARFTEAKDAALAVYENYLWPGEDKSEIGEAQTEVEED